MSKQKKVCACVLVNGHLLSCPYRNQGVGHEINFDTLTKMLEEMLRVVSKENTNPPAKRKRIFIAPVIRKRRKKRWAA